MSFNSKNSFFNFFIETSHDPFSDSLHETEEQASCVLLLTFATLIRLPWPCRKKVASLAVPACGPLTSFMSSLIVSSHRKSATTPRTKWNAEIQVFS